MDYNQITELLSEKKDFDKITLQDNIQGGEKVKFGAIVGNPPYQEADAGYGNGASPIYNEFIDLSATVSSKSVLIHPARFLFNAGKTSKAWNKKILTSQYFSIKFYSANSSEVFNDVDIKGGVAISVYDSSSSKQPINVFIPYRELSSIAKKVKKHHEISLDTIVYPRDLYRLNKQVYVDHPELLNRQSKGHKFDLSSNSFDKLSELFINEQLNEDYAGIYGRENNQRVVKWILKKYLSTPNNFDYYKVIIPKSNGTGAIGEVLSTPLILSLIHI